VSNTLLQVDNLSIHLKPTPHAPQARTLLEACSFALNAGERLTMVGESGAGKSLLAQAIMGTLPAALQARGSIRIKGVSTNGQRELTQALWGHGVMMLPQEPWSALNPLMRMQDQVAEAARYARGLSWPQAQDAASSRLQALGLGHAAQQWLHQISGGMAQRVGVACASVAHAQLLIADEPTKGLDSGACRQVAQLLMAAQTDGQALLTITHDLDLALQLGGQIAVLRQGRILEQGPAKQVLLEPQHAYTRELVAAQPRHWPAYPFTDRSDAPALLQATGLTKRFGPRTLFEGLDLTMGTGEVVAISGPSGCGKTTLGNVLLGVVQADAGQVRRPPGLPAWKFQKLYQDPPAAFSPFRTLGQALDDVCRLHRLPDAGQAGWMQALVLDAGLLTRLPHEVSGGELQRFALLRILLLQPAFIFADEPSSRLDPITQRNTMQVLCESAAQSGCSVLLVSHDTNLARNCSQRQLNLH
jgi:ABC-type glutathione transport system ATPase component